MVFLVLELPSAPTRTSYSSSYSNAGVDGYEPNFEYEYEYEDEDEEYEEYEEYEDEDEDERWFLLPSLLPLHAQKRHRHQKGVLLVQAPDAVP